MSDLRPAAVCGQLLAAMEASDGRRRRRRRDTRPDVVGLAIKRALLEAAVAEDPEAERFEGWLLGRTGNDGAALAMARLVLDEWRMALDSSAFREWLARGAPSADR